MDMPTCFCFVPVFAWMSLRDFAWQAERFFCVLASGRRQFERGLQLFFPFQAVFHYLFYFCGMRVQTRNVLKLARQSVFVFDVS